MHFQAEIYKTKEETESLKVFYTEIQQRLSDEIRTRHDSNMQALVRSPRVLAVVVSFLCRMFLNRCIGKLEAVGD